MYMCTIDLGTVIFYYTIYSLANTTMGLQSYFCTFALGICARRLRS